MSKDEIYANLPDKWPEIAQIFCDDNDQWLWQYERQAIVEVLRNWPSNTSLPIVVEVPSMSYSMRAPVKREDVVFQPEGQPYCFNHCSESAYAGVVGDEYNKPDFSELTVRRIIADVTGVYLECILSNDGANGYLYAKAHPYSFFYDSGAFSFYFPTIRFDRLYDGLPDEWPDFEDVFGSDQFHGIPEFEYQGICELLEHWPNDVDLPIVILGNRGDEFIEGYSIPMDRVVIRAWDNPYTFTFSEEYTYVVGSDMSDPNRYQYGTYLNISEMHVEKMIVDRTGVFLEYMVMRYEEYWDGPGLMPGHAYLRMNQLYHCYGDYPQRAFQFLQSDWKDQRR